MRRVLKPPQHQSLRPAKLPVTTLPEPPKSGAKCLGTPVQAAPAREPWGGASRWQEIRDLLCGSPTCAPRGGAHAALLRWNLGLLPPPTACSDNPGTVAYLPAASFLGRAGLSPCYFIVCVAQRAGPGEPAPRQSRNSSARGAFPCGSCLPLGPPPLRPGLGSASEPRTPTPRRLAGQPEPAASPGPVS